MFRATVCARCSARTVLTYAPAIRPENILPNRGARGIAGGLQQFRDEDAQGSERRWMRGGFELCVASVMKNNDLLAAFVAKYKHHDPQWRSILQLPAGHPVALEVRGRHVNFALRHHVQRGHAQYIIHISDHSVLHPHGNIERTFVTLSRGTDGNCLKTILHHEGPIDGANPHGDRDILAVSCVEGRAGPVDRWKSLVQRSRRSGAIQASMGALDHTVVPHEFVGREDDSQVFLLANHTRSLDGAISSEGLTSSVNIARHPYLYLTEFEAPSPVVADIMDQTAYFGAFESDLVDSKAGEPFLCVGSRWSCNKVFAPPLEADMPFKVEQSRPAVVEDRIPFEGMKEGMPLLHGAPLVRFEQHIHQGSPEFRYEAAPSTRSGHWWFQKDAWVGYREAVYVREGNLKKLQPAVRPVNPFSKTYKAGSMRHLNLFAGATERRKRAGGGDVVVRAPEETVSAASESPSPVVAADAVDGVADRPVSQRHIHKDLARDPEAWHEAVRTRAWMEPSAKALERKRRADAAAARVKGVRVRPKPVQ